MKYRPDETAERVQIAAGIALELPAIAIFEGVEIEGSEHRVRMVLQMTADGVRPTSVEVDGIERPVTGTTLRAVRVWDLAEQAIRLGLDRDGGEPTFVSDEKAAQLRALGPKPETLGWVAFFYNLGNAIGLPPARQVELGLGIPRTTASKWVRRAREGGLIGVDDPEDSEDTLGVAEVAAMMRISKMAVYRLVHSGELPSVQVGRSLRVTARDVREYQQRQLAAG